MATVQLEGLICDSTARATPLAAVKLASESVFRGVTTIEAGEALASSILDRSKVNKPFKTGARSQ